LNIFQIYFVTEFSASLLQSSVSQICQESF